MKIIKISVVLLFTVICSSCGSGIVVSNLTEMNKVKINTVTLISDKEVSEMNGTKVGDILLKENSNLKWSFLKNKLEETAKNNGANYIVVNTIGYNLKGYGFYLEGQMYYSEKPIEIKAENCKVGFVRDRFESLVGSAFPIEIIVEGQLLGELKKDQSLLYQAKNCNDTVNIQVNNKKKEVVLNGKSKYYKIGKQTAGSSSGGGIQIGIGGLSMLEIEDEVLGKLLFLQSK